MTLAPQCYAEDFADYVGSLEYHGLAGVERSTALYRALFDDLAFDVVDQVAEGDRVASRFVLTGSNRGRRVRSWGSRPAGCETGGSFAGDAAGLALVSADGSQGARTGCPGVRGHRQLRHDVTAVLRLLSCGSPLGLGAELCVHPIGHNEPASTGAGAPCRHGTDLPRR
jgi:hypothetical protein